MGEEDINAEDKRKLALSEKVLIGLAGLGLLAVIWLAWIHPAIQDRGIHSYFDCVKAGNPVQMSSPSACVTKSGKRFVEPTDKAAIPY